MNHRIAGEALAYDVVVIGSGIAGMSTALGLAGRRVALLSAGPIGEGTSSQHAQGGIAAAVGDGDSPSMHTADTLAVGAGLNDARVVDLLTSSAPAVVDRLAALGTRFARANGSGYAIGREAGHSLPRIVHAGGDATGRELVAALSRAVADASHVTGFASTHAEQLLRERASDSEPVGGDRVDGGRVIGVLAHAAGGHWQALTAGAVVLATGGIGHAYRRTTNPRSADGSGLVLAADAGARLVDLEFVQFHPTALACDGEPLPLLTEALRGAGAELVDDRGHRFLFDVHPDGELAPRDVVARALWLRQQEGTEVLLDLRPVADLFERFPTSVAICRRYGYDPLATPVPVTPAAHYHMGGIAVDSTGSTSVPGLYACGEVACTGAHGANRLASNSLLEAAVFAGRLATHLERAGLAAPASGSLRSALAGVDRARTAEPSPRAMREVRDLLWRDVGLMRSDTGLRRALTRLDVLAQPRLAGSLAQVGRLVATAALHRRESRGAHARTDYSRTGRATRRVFVTASARGRPRARAAEQPSLASAAC